MEVFAAATARRLEEVPQRARWAEELGFDGVVFGELTLDPFLASALALEHTQRLRVATGIALAFPRSPTVTAYMAWALQDLGRGRFELGLGTQVKGHIQRRFGVPWEAPGPRLREYILALRAVWECWQTGRPLDFRGQFYSLTLMTPEFSPDPLPYPDIPVAIAAVNRYNLRLAGELCQGVLLHGFCTLRYAREVALPEIEEGARRAGRPLEDVKVWGGGFVVTGATPQEVQRGLEEARRRIAFYASTRTYLPVMQLHGWEEVGLQLHRLSLEGAWDRMAPLITDDMLREFCVAATYDSLAPAVAQKYGGWAHRIVIPLPPQEPLHRRLAPTAIAAIKGA